MRIFASFVVRLRWQKISAIYIDRMNKWKICVHKNWRPSFKIFIGVLLWEIRTSFQPMSQAFHAYPVNLIADDLHSQLKILQCNANGGCSRRIVQWTHFIWWNKTHTNCNTVAISNQPANQPANQHACNSLQTITKSAMHVFYCIVVVICCCCCAVVPDRQAIRDGLMVG